RTGRTTDRIRIGTLAVVCCALGARAYFLRPSSVAKMHHEFLAAVRNSAVLRTFAQPSQGLVDGKAYDAGSTGLFEGDPWVGRSGGSRLAGGYRRTVGRAGAVGNGNAQAACPGKMDYLRVRPRRPTDRTRNCRGPTGDPPASLGRTL